MSLRITAAIATLVSAYVHFKLWMDGMSSLHVVGPAFLVNAVAGAVIAVLVLVWRHWLPALLVAGFGASTLGALIISSTVGLFGHHEPWQGPYVWASAIAEVACILLGLAIVAMSAKLVPLTSRREPQHHHAG